MKNAIIAALICMHTGIHAMQMDPLTKNILDDNKTGWEKLPKDVSKLIAKLIMQGHPAIEHVKKNLHLLIPCTEKTFNTVKSIGSALSPGKQIIALQQLRQQQYQYQEQQWPSSGFG